jgi:hypothetical protein
MSAAKFVLVTLFAVSSATVTRSETSANVRPSRLFAVAQHDRQPGTWNSRITDEQATARVPARPSEKWLVALLFAGLAAYQLGRNQRSLSHRLSSY